MEQDLPLSQDDFLFWREYKQQLIDFYKTWNQINHYRELIDRKSNTIKLCHTFKLKTKGAVGSLIDASADDLFHKIKNYQNSVNELTNKLNIDLDLFIEKIAQAVIEVSDNKIKQSLLIAMKADAEKLKANIVETNSHPNLPSLEELKRRVEHLQEKNWNRARSKSPQTTSNTSAFFTVFTSDKNLAQQQDEQQEENRP